MRVRQFSSFTKDTISLIARVLSDIDVGPDAFLCNSEVAFRLMHTDGAHTVSIETIVSFDLFCIKVVSLILITSYVDNLVIF